MTSITFTSAHACTRSGQVVNFIIITIAVTMPDQFLAALLTFSVENVAAVAIITGAALFLSLKFTFRSHSKKLPPLSDTGMIETLEILMDGKGAPDLYLSTMAKKGLIYRLPLPEMYPWIVVCDPALVRRILNEEEEKPALYRRISGATNGVINIFNAPTSSHSYLAARKGMAPSFSMANIVLSLPKMYQKIDGLKKILIRHESEKSTIDLPELMTQLTMDFICAGKSLNSEHRFISLESYATSDNDYAIDILPQQCSVSITKQCSHPHPMVVS